jgi:hypothetical protein
MGDCSAGWEGLGLLALVGAISPLLIWVAYKGLQWMIKRLQ